MILYASEIDNKAPEREGLRRAACLRGRYQFTSREAQQALKVSADATKLALNRLRHQGRVASPARGFYVIVPPEYRALGCLPAEQFIPALMAQPASPTTRAAVGGAIPRRRPSSPAGIPGIPREEPPAHRVRQGARGLLCAQATCGRADEGFNTARGVIRVSTPEATAIDLAGYPQHAGGLSQVATVLAELAQAIDPALMPASRCERPLPWAQRLGYLLERADAANAARALHDYIAERAREYTALVPGVAAENAVRESRWKVIVNTEVEPDL